MSLKAVQTLEAQLQDSVDELDSLLQGRYTHQPNHISQNLGLRRIMNASIFNKETQTSSGSRQQSNEIRPSKYKHDSNKNNIDPWLERTKDCRIDEDESLSSDIKSVESIDQLDDLKLGAEDNLLERQNNLRNRHDPSVFQGSYRSKGFDKLKLQPSTIVSDNETFKTNFSESTYFGTLTSARRRINTIQNMFKSIKFFRHQEVKCLTEPDEIVEEVNQYRIRKVEMLSVRTNNKSTHVKDSLDEFRRIEAFCECASIGSRKHLNMMSNILKEDPRRNLIETSSSTHLINKKNRMGYNAIYLASKHGNIEAVKFLIGAGAIHNCLMKIDGSSKKYDNPIQAAASWGHAEVVNFFLNQCRFQKNELLTAHKSATREDIKSLIANNLKNNYPSRSYFFSRKRLGADP